MTVENDIIFSFGDVRVAPADFKIWKGDDELGLEPKAFQVLVYLLRNRGRLVEKSELLDGVWKDTFVTENALTREIAKLRKALGDDPKDARYIQTVHTRGYRLVAEVIEVASTWKGNAPSYDVGPPQRQPESAKNEPRLPYKWLLAGSLCVVLLLVGFFGYRALVPGSQQIESIAVMPFVNASGDAAVEYLSDGMTEVLISSLSQLPNLNVKPRSSVFRYKGKESDPQLIGKELNVQAVLNGRVVKRDGNLSLFVELIDVSLDKVVWSQQYNRTQADLVTLQSEVARDVSSKIEAKLSTADEIRVTKPYSTNPEAYDFYLWGRYHFAKRSQSDLLTSIDYYQQAITLDPKFALAYVGIAEAYADLPGYPYLSPNDAMPKAKTAVANALELDPQLPEAHSVRAFIAATYDWDWAESEREFKKALELDPKLAVAHYWYASVYLSPLGRHDEALTEMERAIELEPLSVPQGAAYAAVLMFARKFDLAVDQARRTYDLDPNQTTAQNWICHTLNAKGSYKESLQFAENVKREDNTFFSQMSYAHARIGQRQEADEIVRKWKETERSKYVSYYGIAVTDAALGNLDAAFADLERSYQAHDRFLQAMKVDPFLDPLRKDPRFAAFVKRLGLPQ